jgi:hypothetical protein
MPVDLNQLRETTTLAVIEVLKAQYENGDPEGMRPFASAIAQAAVSAVEHVVLNAEIVGSGERIQ